MYIYVWYCIHRGHTYTMAVMTVHRLCNNNQNNLLHYLHNTLFHDGNYFIHIFEKSDSMFRSGHRGPMYTSY